MPRRQRGGSRGVGRVIIQLGGSGGRQPTLSPGCFTPWQRAQYPLLVGPRGRSGQVQSREHLFLLLGFKSRIFQPVAGLDRLCYLGPLQVYAVGRFGTCFILQVHTNCLCSIPLFTHFFDIYPTFVVKGTSNDHIYYFRPTVIQRCTRGR